MLSAKTSPAEVERQRQWQRSLIEALGPELRQCVEWMHDDEPSVLPTVLACLRRIGMTYGQELGIRCYWRAITLWKQGQNSEVWPRS